MSAGRPGMVDWMPEVLPFAPRPINGELLSSWARRLAAANGITLGELCASLGGPPGAAQPAGVFDYAAPKPWRRTIARLARVPEPWVWVLDLAQQFPALGREWFLHDPAAPERIFSGFCPECFAEQIARGGVLHLKAEWALALVTRCLRHRLPLYRDCPWCGRDQPVTFDGPAAVRCLGCGHALTVRRWSWRPEKPEPAIAEFLDSAVRILAGQAPHAVWTGRSLRAVLPDLIWMLTTAELVDPARGHAVVDPLAPEHLVTEQAYGADFDLPFPARSWQHREAVVAAIVRILAGPPEAVADSSSNASAEPFVAVLRLVRRNQRRLWQRIRQWPGPLRDRAAVAIDWLAAKGRPQPRPRGSERSNPAGKSWSSRSAGHAGNDPSSKPRRARG